MLGVIMESSTTANNILRYIENKKSDKLNKDESILSLILEYCERNDIDEEIIGEIISKDSTLLSIIKNDCIKYKFMKSEINPTEDW